MRTDYPSQAPESVRKRLLVPNTNMTDDSMTVGYTASADRILVVHQTDANNGSQIQADEKGVWYHKKSGGSWSTVPQAISVGGTGATDLLTAMQNLEIAYKNGDVYAISGATPLYGYVTENTTRLMFTIITPRRMRAGSISRITINSLSAVLRGCNGYLDSNNSSRNLIASPFSAETLRLSENMVRFAVTKSSAFTNVQNNTPIMLQATFSVTFRT